MVYPKRIEKAQQLLAELNIEAVVVTSPSNFYYFSGIWLDSHERLQAIVIKKNGKPNMIVHEMSREEVDSTDLFLKAFWKDGEASLEVLAKSLPESGTISIDNQWPSQNLLTLMKLNSNLTFEDSTNVIGWCRLKKDELEIELLRRSAAVADVVIQQAIEFIQPGLTEKYVAEEIKRFFAAHKVDELSFYPIVGTGRNGAIPHHLSDETVIAEGDMVVIDMGGIKDHYCSDMTRTILASGEPSAEMKKVYGIVKRAQEEAVKAVRPGVPLKNIDNIAREIISQEGYGANYTHRTGHGLGIEVHEEPYVTSNNEQLLEEGMVISVEPGIYLEGKFGVRIEDIVVVTATGSERLNNVSRDLITSGKGSSLIV
ncbi:aminopeptidase P family protein [Bacillus sp. M6-12]|uniref:M24 family metallopeptidase n=1 Tax=Bacillus sp. M6-12 TaxID=2054166 RepID=UPI000C787C49|nr:Xaa-Pro peptidase family protein [Bacillus sp. M6-12]PLS18307.1 aminopeptidase P family protein [Bacillus sp. M6-12]